MDLTNATPDRAIKVCRRDRQMGSGRNGPLLVHARKAERITLPCATRGELWVGDGELRID